MKNEGLPWKEKARELTKRLGKFRYAGLVLLAGVLLLLWPAGGAAQQEENAAVQETGAEFDLEELERRLGETLSQIAGVGETSVILTLRSSGEEVLAENTSRDDTRQETDTVIVSGGSGTERPVMVQTIYPEFQGAIVVCAGGNDPAVRLSVTQAVGAITGLSSDKISICQRK